MSNPEPVPSIESIIEDFVQDYDADVAAIHQLCLVGAITIEQQTAESEERWKHHMKRAKARHERICAHERLKGQIKEVKRCIKGMGAAAHLMDRAELQERLAELEALQTQLEGKTK